MNKNLGVMLIVQKGETTKFQEKELKVLVVGLDGASFKRVESWAKEGKLPNLRKMMKEGVCGPLRSMIPPSTPPAWTSFMTGKNPGNHGIFGFSKREMGAYEITVENALHIDGKTLWAVLSEHGKRVIVINVPMTYPVEKVNGILISGYLTPPGSIATHPPELKKEIAEKVRGYRIYMKKNDPFGKNKKSVQAWLEDLYSVTRKTADVAHYLLDKYEWDFFIVVFNGTDWISHVFWRYMDPKCIGYDSDIAKEYQNAVVEYYQEIDSIIGDLTNRTNKNTVLMIMSDHGNGPAHKIFYINQWLIENGFIKLKKKKSSGNMYFWLSKLGLKIENVILFLLAHQWALKLSKSVWNIARMRFSILDNIDWTQTQAYGCESGIIINRKDREAKGIVEPNEEYENLRDLLIEKLSTLKDQETGEKVFKQVLKREELYTGPHVDEAPDIILLTNPPFLFSRGIEIRRTIVRSNINFLPGPLQSSRHEIDGLFIATGSQIRKGKKINDVNLTDLAPTMLHTMNVPSPHDVDGRVLKEIFEPTSQWAKKKTRYLTYRESNRGKQGFTKEEEEELKKRLKALGYLG